MQELWLLEVLKSWRQNPRVLFSLFEESHQLRRCVRWRTPSDASISTAIPYIARLLLEKWFIALLLLLLACFSSPLAALQAFKVPTVDGLLLTRWLCFTITQFTRYIDLLRSLFLWLCSTVECISITVFTCVFHKSFSKFVLVLA